MLRYGLIDKVLVPQYDKGSKLDQDLQLNSWHRASGQEQRSQGTRDPWSGQAGSGKEAQRAVFLCHHKLHKRG